MLEIRGLDVRYGPTHALRGVDIDVAAGEAVALLGPNGAGKTSLLRAVSGLISRRGGVSFDGTDLAGRSPSSIARLGLVHVPEGRHVFPTLSVHENLQMGEVAAAGRTGAFGFAEVYDLLPALAKMRRREGYALSGGEQQMVAIGRALVAAPRLLLLDEPSLGLAPVVARAIYDALATVAATVPMLVVEQNTVDALDLCARAYVLAAGSVVLSGSAAELSDRESLLASFLGQRDAVEPRRPAPIG
jgi:branched-chain amino acid transport system ATP-binding protein